MRSNKLTSTFDNYKIFQSNFTFTTVIWPFAAFVVFAVVCVFCDFQLIFYSNSDRIYIDVHMTK